MSEPKTVAGLRPFKLERYFALHEFSAPHLLCCSDCEPLKMKEVLELASLEERGLWDDLVSRLGWWYFPAVSVI
jgi:hypothetical protein